MEAEIEVLSPGLFSTIQDPGRFGFMKFGVPVSGAMDKYASRICNLLLGNEIEAAVMEITLQGPKLKFHQELTICLSGADLDASLNDRSVKRNEILKIKNDDVLKFGRRRSGFRAYLGVSGGFDTETVMNSRSWYDGLTEEFKLEKGMRLSVKSSSLTPQPTHSSIKVDEDYLNETEIKVFLGPEFEELSKEQQGNLFDQIFNIGGSSNRMAVRLSENFSNELSAIITGPVIPGTVQLTPAGNIIVLMQDCQTTGGYPRILQLSEYGKQVLSQKMPGEKIQFIKREY